MNIYQEFRQSKINWQVIKQVFLQGKTSKILPPQPLISDTISSSNMPSLQQLQELIKPIIEEINSVYEQKIQQLMIMKNIELQVLDKKIGILENEITFLKRDKNYQGSRIIKNMSSKVQTKIDQQQNHHKSFIYIQQSQHQEEEQSLLQPQTQQKRPVMPTSHNKTIFKEIAKLSNYFNPNERRLFHNSSERFKEKSQENENSRIIPQSARFFEEQTKILKQQLTGLRIAIQKIHNVKVPYQQTCQSIITSPRPTVRSILNISSHNQLEHLSNQNKHLRNRNNQLLMKLLEVQQQLQNIKYILIESLESESQVQQQ